MELLLSAIVVSLTSSFKNLLSNEIHTAKIAKHPQRGAKSLHSFSALTLRPLRLKKINNKNDEHLNSYQEKVTIAFGSKKIRVSFKNTTSTQYLEFPIHNYQPNTHANTRGATIVASLSIMYLGV